jgi:hypothetical protein
MDMIENYDESSSLEESSAAEGGNDSISGEPEVIGQKETKDVFRFKLVVLLVLIFSAFGASGAVYHYTSSSEEANFRARYADNSEKVLQSIGKSLDKTVGSFDGIAVAFVSYARSTNQSWPFVTLPDFALRMSKIMPLTDAININVLPIVSSRQRELWEAYSVQHDYWVNEGMKIQEGWDGYYGPVVYNGSSCPVIHGDFGDIGYDVR